VKTSLIKRTVIWLGAAVVVAGLSAAAPGTAQAEPLKVGFVYVGPVGDHG